MAKIEDLRNEYQQLGYHLRLIATFRIGILSVFPALVGALVRFMWEVSQKETGLLLRILLPFGGFIATVIVALVERRIIPLYDLLIRRGADLEEIVDIHDGIYHRIIRLLGAPTLRDVATAFFVAVGILFLVVFMVQTVALMKGIF